MRCTAARSSSASNAKGIVRTATSRRRRRAIWPCCERARSWAARAACVAARVTASELPRLLPGRLARGSGSPRPALVGQRGDPSQLVALEPARQGAVDDHRVQLAPELASQSLAQLQRLGGGHLRRLGDREVGRAGRILQQLAHLARLSRDRADACDRGEHLRRAQHRQGVPRRGRVEHDEVVGGAPLLRATARRSREARRSSGRRLSASSHSLTMLSISRAPGAAAIRYWKLELEVSTRAGTRPPSARSHSARTRSRSIDRPQSRSASSTSTPCAGGSAWPSSVARRPAAPARRRR